MSRLGETLAGWALLIACAVGGWLALAALLALLRAILTLGGVL